MLSYKQKIRGSRAKVTMDNFDLYADLPPLVPVEDDKKPPAMTVTDIKTLQKHPYMAGARRSSVMTGSTSNSSSSTDSWLPSSGASSSDLLDRRMMESFQKPAVSFDLSPKKKPTNDYVEVLPQNTVPMAKHRKNFIRKKMMKESAELEGTLTDEEIWKRRKTQEEQARIASIKRRQFASGKGGLVKNKEFDDGFDKIHEKRTLEEEIFKPTYVADADLDEESFFSAIGKSLPRRKIAVVSAVMQKIEKRRQEREERMLNEKIMAELNTIGERSKETSSKTGGPPTPTMERSDDAIKEETDEQLHEPNQSPGNATQVKADDVNGNDDSTRPHNTSLVNRDVDTDDNDAAVKPEKAIERKESTNRPPRLHPVAKRPSFLQKMGHAKSEGNIVAALNASFSPPDDFCDTGAMISYSEILMASAKHLEHTVSMIDISQPSNPLQSGAYVPQLSDYATVRDDRQEAFVLPPEIGELDSESDVVDFGYDSPATLAASLGSLNRPMSAHPTGTSGPSREPIYSKVRKKTTGSSRGNARRQSTNLSARRRMHRSQGSNLNATGKHGQRARISRSASSGDVGMLDRLASIVEKQNELMQRWQDMEEARLGVMSRRSLRNSRSLYSDNQSLSEFDAELLNSPLSRRPSVGISMKSVDSLSDSSVNYELQTQFDDITYATVGPRPHQEQFQAGSIETVFNQPLPSQSTGLAASTLDASVAKPDISKLAQKPTKPTNVSSNVPRSQVKSPDGHIYNEREIIRPTRRVASESTDPSIGHTDFQPTAASSKPPTPSLTPQQTKTKASEDHVHKLPVLRKKSTRREITKESSQVIKIDIINSHGEKVEFEDTESGIPSLGNATTSRSNSAAGVRRRRSLIRVQGIRNQRGESVEQLNEKIQSVIDAGTGMDGANEGWWVLWSKREGGDNNGEGKLVKRVTSFFRKDDIEKRKEIDVVAELVQKLPGESGEDFSATQRAPVTDEPTEAAVKNATPLITQSRKPSFKRKKSQKMKKKLMTVPSVDENVSDVAPLPSPEVDVRKPRRFSKQPSFDSGVSTNPTDDDAGDVSPKSHDGRVTSPLKVATQRPIKPPRNPANLPAAKQDDSPPADDKEELENVSETTELNVSSETPAQAEESFLKKIATFFGVSYEEPPPDRQTNNDGPKAISIFG